MGYLHECLVSGHPTKFVQKIELSIVTGELVLSGGVALISSQVRNFGSSFLPS